MDYNSLCRCINKIKNKKNVTIKVIGKSVLNKNIYAILVCQNFNLPWVIITAGIHAREHLSTNLVIRQVQQFLSLYKQYSYNVAFVPLVNPDGANLAIYNLKNISAEYINKLIKINDSVDFSLYKANANGVDLNNNFNARWYNQFTNKYCPSSQGYYGPYPFSEPEALALAEFTKKIKPFITISYHLKGEEIYFDFFQSKKNYDRDKKIAQVFAKATGYTIKSTQHCSSGGYKDWCVQKLKIPALTIELGSDKFSHPYPQNQIMNIYSKNKEIFNCLQTSLQIYNMEKTYETHGRGD